MKETIKELRELLDCYAYYYAKYFCYFVVEENENEIIIRFYEKRNNLISFHYSRETFTQNTNPMGFVKLIIKEIDKKLANTYKRIKE